MKSVYEKLVEIEDEEDKENALRSLERAFELKILELQKNIAETTAKYLLSP